MKLLILPTVLTFFAAMPPLAAAQPAAPPPPPGWAGSAGAGLALTSGNSDTSTVNAAYELKRDTGGNYRVQEQRLAGLRQVAR